MFRERAGIDHSVRSIGGNGRAQAARRGFEEDRPLGNAEDDHHARKNERHNGKKKTH
ncbi:hypothetical protein [Cryobacterium breve]|uniref:hypothetical protein n=1 Tax=Cryobacterium breve TaxID=1259258 RepID=UPI00248B7D5B|nr:hypothetical protein [Cryobacterium breve]